MNRIRFNRNHTFTEYVRLNTHRCVACWKCIDNCPKKVFGKVDLPWHKHALIINPEGCSGCLRCVKGCEHGALVDKKENGPRERSAPDFLKLINIILLLSTIGLVVAGFVLQVNYHIGHHGGIEIADTVWGMDYSSWSTIHKITAILFTFATALHIYHNRKLFKNRQKVIFLLILIFTSLTGFLAWYYSYNESSDMTRKILIEIHDKLTLFLSLFMVIHIWNKRRRFIKF